MPSSWLGIALFFANPEYFETHIRPALAEHCASCHSGERAQGALRLDYRAGWQRGGKAGPAIIPGDPGNSPLVRAIRHSPQTTPMPLGAKKLPDAVVARFEEWIRMGAPDPRDSPPPAPTALKPWSTVFEERKKWWSLKPVARQAASASVDGLIGKKLIENGLSLSSEADRATLIRRLTFVLTGLPPTPDELSAFAADTRPGAYERQVDRLLRSPHFGERWARHWMDVVRYTDTYGYEWDIPAKGAWRYRDYLIRAFNRDVPYDQLVREQIAGDLLPNPRTDPMTQTSESLIGPMFFQLGENRHGDSLQFNGIHQEMIDNKIGAFSKTFLATTVGCARCHDHKLDAVAQTDYYALAGAFTSPRWVTNTLDLPERNRATFAKLREIKAKLRDELARAWTNAAIEPTLPPKEAKLTVEDPHHVWAELSKSSNIAETWRKLAADYARLNKERTEVNQREFTPLADFREGPPPGWSIDGIGVREGRAATGDFTVALDGPGAVGRILAAGLYTDTLSPRLNGAIRSPYLGRPARKRMSFQVAGGDFASHRIVVENAFLTERQVYLKDPMPHWVKLPSTGVEKPDRPWSKGEEADTRIFVEFATKTSNPNFPPRVGLGGKTTAEDETDAKSWFGISRVYLHDKDESLADELARFLPLFEGPAPQSLDEARARYSAWLRASVKAWTEGRSSDEDVRLLNWMLRNNVLSNPGQSKLVEEYRATEKRIADPMTVNGLADLDPGIDYRLNKRGVYEDLGDHVPRGFVSALARGTDKPGRSGRLEIAEAVASPDNPLTARVFVNRVWHWVFGAGLVTTTDDFGHLGERPSHPELLDYLAAEFVRNGWSTRRLIRELVTSRSFRQSGHMSDKAREVDPTNRLLHHYPLRRLEAEAIRDSMLAISGRLDPMMYGPPINPNRVAEDSEKRLFSGPLDGHGRRSLYIKMTIMEPPKFLETFNQPAPKIPTGRRDVTNVAAQALALLNDPFVAAQSETWGKRLVASTHASPEQRVEEMFLRAVGRKPTPADVARWSRAAADFASLHKVPSGDVMASLLVWRDMAHAVFNTKEFLYYR